MKNKITPFFIALMLSFVGFNQAPTTVDVNFMCDSPGAVSQTIPAQTFVLDNGGGIDYTTFDLDLNLAGYQHSITSFTGLINLTFNPNNQTLTFTYSGPACASDGQNFFFNVKSLSGQTSNTSQFFTFVEVFAYPPVVNDDSYTINQGEVLNYISYTANDYDSFGFANVSNFTIFNSNVQNEYWNVNFNNLNFIPPSEFSGTATVQYSFGNYCGLSNIATITINVLPALPPSDGIFGTVFLDNNIDCIKDASESGIQGALINIQPGNIIAQTNDFGFWNVDTLIDGIYTATLNLNNSLWESSCLMNQTFTVQNGHVLVAPLMGVNYTTQCPKTSVSVLMPTIRRCFSDQIVYVNVTNHYDATGIAQNQYVELSLDPLLTVNSSSIPNTPLGNNLFRFDIGNLNIGQSTNFTLNTTVDCNTVLGQTLCLEANLFPVESCSVDTIIENPTFPSGVTPCTLPWDRSSLSVDGWCANDSIYFSITNTGDLGEGDMDCYAPVRIYIDGQMYQFDSIQLLGGQTFIYVFAGTGQTWHLEADQHPLHPGHSHPNATVELCGDAANWTPGLVTILPQDDADPVVDIYCGMVTGSYDPNDKQGFPLGIGQNHDIMPNQDLEYTIRFQNTGTDTAFTVVIRDTLDMDLDILSVVEGASSHNYTFTMQGPRVLEWTFSNILLPDSTTNSTESNGFVTFTVNQNLNLVNGTQITNTAGIYFDFNDPIITNQTLHTINSCIQNNTVSNIQITSCNSYTAPDGQIYDTTGIYTAIIPNAMACDSIITINLTINNSSDSSLTVVACNSYTAPDGQNYAQSGMYTAIIPNAMACDSIITIDLTIKNSSDSSITVISCGDYTAPDGQMLSQSGLYDVIIPNSVSCDSIIHVNLTIGILSSISESACTSYTAPDGQVYTQSGIYTAVIPSSQGCDSIITITLSVGTFSSITETVCSTYTAPDGQVYTNSGIYTAIIPNSQACDSTITINLTVGTTNSISETVCQSYTAPDGQVYSSSGNYVAVIPSFEGCDSTIFINLTIKNSTSSTLTESACTSYTAPDGQVYTTSGTYTAILPNTQGCDSIITINLTIGTSSSLNEIACQTYTAPDGQILTQSGIYTIIIPNSQGCDSTITINLTVGTSSVLNESVCDTYTAPDGQIYDTTGVYTAIIPNSQGCDSTITINLTVGTFGFITTSSCVSYIAPDGQNYTQSGIYTAIIQSQFGCDSIITIDLTIKNNTTSSISDTVCQSYTAPDGQVYTQSGIYTAVIPNVEACDSIISIDLTILDASTSTISETVCGSYTASDGQVYTNSGSYTAIIPNAMACDSIITINLTVKNTSSSTITTEACNNYTAPDNQILTASGTYTAILVNNIGCDSIITINLTIHHPTSSTITKTQCGEYTAPDGQVYTQSGVYTSILPNANGCDSVITLNLNLTIVNAAVLQTGSTLTAVADANVFQWINCSNNQAINGETNQSYTPSQAGNYALIVEAGGCSDTSICFAVGNLSLNENAVIDYLNVFPNPTNDILNVEFKANETFELIITDLNGKILLKEYNNFEKTIVNVSSLPKGVYMIELTSQGQHFVKRFTKI